MRQGELPAFKLGRLWKVREADLDAYIRDAAGAASELRADAKTAYRPRRWTGPGLRIKEVQRQRDAADGSRDDES